MTRINSVLDGFKVKNKSKLSDSNYRDRVYCIKEDLEGCEEQTKTQLETTVLSYFDNFMPYLIKKSKDNISTFNGEDFENCKRGLSFTSSANVDMDDQGFQGCWQDNEENDRVFARYIEDYYEGNHMANQNYTSTNLSTHVVKKIDKIIKDEDDKVEIHRLSDSQLEDAWQGQCMMIKMALEQYYKTEDESFRVKAEEAQEKQSVIQKEITRRH